MAAQRIFVLLIPVFFWGGDYIWGQHLLQLKLETVKESIKKKNKHKCTIKWFVGLDRILQDEDGI